MKGTIDDVFKNVNDQISTVKKTAKAGFIGGAVGAVVGLVGGVYLGESLNDYVTVLQQAPAAIQYAVDGVSALICASVTSQIFGAVAQIPGMYKTMKRF